MADKTIPALKILRGNVGISTATPAVKLHVEGNDIRVNTEGSYQAKTLYFRYSSGAAINSDSYLTLGTGGSPAERMRVISNGNIGIATTTPGAKLDVNGSAIFRGAAGWAGNDNQACAIYLNTAGRGVMGNFSNYARNLVKANSNYVEVGQNSTLVYGVKFIVGSNAPNGFMFQSNIGGSMTTHMSIRGDTGNVGIGTNAPGGVLHVDGNTIIGDTDRQSVVLTLKAQNTAGAPAATTQIRMKGYEGRGIGTFYEDSSYSGKEWFCGMNYSAAFGTWNVGYDASGGQAEYNANTLFRVRYTGRVEMLNYGSGNFTGTAAYKLAVDSSGNIIETAAGAGVDGSGTANKLALWTDVDTIGDSIITQSGTAYAQINGGVRITGNHTDTGSQLNIWCDNSGHARAAAYNYFFYSGSNNSRSNLALFLSNNGSVGINTASPSAKLHVHGGNVVVTSGKQLISTNTYSQAPIGMLTIQGPTNGGTTINSDVWGLVIGPQHTRSSTANTYYPGIAFNHLLNHGGTTTYNNSPQAWIGTRLHDTSGSERDFLVFALKSSTVTDSQPVERMCIDPIYGSIGIGTTDPSCLLQLGTDGVQGGASLAIRRNGDAINFGHVNGAGYGSVIGCSSNNGQPHIGFMCEAGTNINTFRTRGLKGNVIYTNTSGTLYFAQVTNANADNQSLTNRVAIESDGDAYFYGGNWFCNTNNSTNVSNGGLYINRGGGLYAYALATARSGTALNGVDFWDYHGVGLVFGPDSSTKVLTVKSNIGIGTTNPGYILDVRTASLGAMQVKGSGSNGLLIGEAAYSQSANYTGLKTSYMTGAQDYMIISGTATDGNTYVSAKSGSNLHLRAGGNNSGNEMVVSTSTGITYKSGVRHEFSTGNVGINTSTVNVKLAVAGQASFADRKLSLIGLDINSGGTPSYIKIRTKIPFASGSADFTVNIKGFRYGSAQMVDITVGWHYYNSTFYNPSVSSSGAFAPTVKLSAEDWDSSGTKKVCIVLVGPGYWPKLYVDSMYSSAYKDSYAAGWTWVDADATGTGNDLATLSYKSDFGNNFKMLSNGCVGIGGGILTNAQLTVNGGLAVGDATYQSNMNNGAADFSVDCNGTPMISWVSNYLQVGGTGQNWSMKMYNGLLQTYSNDLTIIGGGTGTSHKLHLGTNGQTQTITCNNGSVGINTTSPGYKLDVYGGDARIGTNLRLGNGSAAGNSTNPAITSSGVTTAGVYFENSGVGFGAGSGSKYLFLSSAGNASLGGNGFFKQLGDRPYGTDNLNDYYRSNDEASFCQFYRYDATHGHWANSSGTLTTNAPSTLTQTTSQIYSYGSLLTLRSINSFRGQFYFAHSASEFYWRSGWGTNGDQNWTRIVGDRNIQTVIHNVGHITTKAGNNLTVGGSITVQPGSGDGILFLKNSAASQILRLDQNSIRTTTNSQIVLFTNGNSNQLYLSSGGNVGIGTNNPNGLLNVAGNTKIGTAGSPYSGTNVTSLTINGVYPVLSLGNTSNRFSILAYSTYTNYETVSNAHHVFSGGNVGVSTTSPAATLDVKQGTANNNNKLMKVADDVLSVYKVTGLSNHTVTLTCGSYFQAEVVITANQTNGGTYNNLYIRGIWSNNHHSHHWDEIENIGSLSGSSFSIAVSANDVSNSGKLTITHSYSSGSFSQMVVRVTDLYGVHSYSIT